MKSIQDKLKERAELQQKQIERQEEYKRNLQKIAIKLFSTEEGKIFKDAIKSYCKVETIDFDLSPERLAYEKGLRNVYLTFFEVLLTTDVS